MSPGHIGSLLVTGARAGIVSFATGLDFVGLKVREGRTEGICKSDSSILISRRVLFDDFYISSSDQNTRDLGKTHSISPFLF